MSLCATVIFEVQTVNCAFEMDVIKEKACLFTNDAYCNKTVNKSKFMSPAKTTVCIFITVSEIWQCRRKRALCKMTCLH